LVHFTAKLCRSLKNNTIFNNWFKATRYFMKLQKIISLIFVILPIMALSFEKPDLKFERLSIDHGLSQGNINTIIQDRSGFMWFGTQDGLNRYDGYEFVVYKPVPGNPRSISSNVVKALFETSDGRILVGTAGGGLSIYNPESDDFTSYLHNPNDLSSISHNSVFSVYEDKDSVIWVGTFGGGVCQFNPETQSFTRYQHNPSDPNSLSGNAIRAIFEDHDGELWIGVDGAGLNKFDRARRRFLRYQHNPADDESLGSDIVLTVMVDKEGYFWVGSWAGGISRFNPRDGKTRRFRHSPSDPYSINSNETFAFLQDSQGRIWVSTRNGLDILDLETGRFYHYLNDPLIETTISHNVIIALFQDKSGVFWVGSEGGGINKVDLNKKKFTHYRHDYRDANSLSSNEITAIYLDSRGLYWIGTRNGGVNIVDFNNDKYRVLTVEKDKLSSNFVNCILEDRTGMIWLGTNGGGITRYNYATGAVSYFREDLSDPNALQNNAVFAMVEDRFGDIWLGTYGGGVGRYIAAENRFKTYVIDAENQMSNVVLSLVEDPSGVIYGGSFGHGLIELDREKDRFVFYEHNPEQPNSISNNVVTTLFLARDGYLWVGTGGSGLDRFDRRSRTFINYNTSHGLVSDNISGVLDDDDGNVWVTTVKGMSRFNVESKVFRNYDRLDGLQDNDFIANSMLLNPEGYMFFGGAQGLNVFHPSSIVDDTTRPQISITDFKLFNESVSPEPGGVLETCIGLTKRIELSYLQNNFSFEFSALHFAAPSKNKYKYMMEGFDSDWYEASYERRFAAYTNLPGGQYTFKVIGSNSDNIWNEDGASVTIVIHPPFYNTWWFYTLVASVLASIVFAFFKYKEKQNLLHKAELQGQITAAIEEVEKQKKEIVQQNMELQVRQEEDKKRQWFNEGIAMFAEIMRKHKDDINALASHTLSNLIRYVGAAQGGIFVINDENPEHIYLQLVSSYGYDALAAERKNIEIGEGLVGNCYKEKATKRFEKLPDGYLSIQSSLGSTQPACLVLIPLRLDELIFGVMEISALKNFNDFEIEFLEKLAESVTSQLFTAKISMKTSQLLDQSQKQAEELRSQEEEARQNIEEMQANREEAVRLKAEAMGFINSMNHSIIRADFALDGGLSYANTRFLDYFGYKSKEVRGMDVSKFFLERDRTDFMQKWKALLSGSRHIEEKFVHKAKDGEIMLLSTFTVVKDVNGESQSVLYLGLDVAEKASASVSRFDETIRRLDTLFVSCTVKPDGTIVSVNEKFTKLYGYSTDEVIDLDIRSFILAEMSDAFEADWKKCLEGEIVERLAYRKTSQGQALNLYEYYFPVRRGDTDFVSEVVVYACDISKLNDKLLGDD
jgi:PAS domain S-box-containing protein